MTALLRVEGVAYAYPDGSAALEGIDVEVRAGERVALLGPNGAGKSTLLLALIGVLHPSAGSVAVGGTTLRPDSVMEIRRRTGIVFQDPDDQLFMPSVGADVAFGPSNFGLAGSELEERVTAALAAVSMEGAEMRPPHHLSMGERRRVAIATVLAMEPALLLLDEPASNLDPEAKRRLVGLLAGLDATLVVATHDLPLALQLCPRAVVLNAGRVVADMPTAALLGDEALLEANSLPLPFGFGGQPDIVSG